MSGILVIVESPAKAKTITRYLGRGYTVRASMGHVRDLPAKRLGVEVDNGTFQPEYEDSPLRYKTINEIRTLAKDASQVLLATDPDREGEAIAWHIVSAASLGRGKQTISRVEFHEITEKAIKAAIASPRQLDMNLINAQQARRVLDRLVGYKISPLLWKKVQAGTSAGRVQSVALRIVVEREREIEEFVPREFWTVEADLARSPFSKKKSDVFRAILWDAKENKKLEYEKGEQAQTVVEDLNGSSWKIANITKKEGLRRPSPPFITSTLQQEASRKLRFSSQQTMQIAQQLYEGVSLGAEGTTGLITYMRTDSTNVAFEAQNAARDVIKNLFGPDYVPAKPNFFAKKAKGAQEAHEAIRPTKPEREPDNIRQWLTAPQFQLYRLIWRRFIASQMAAARIEHTVVDVHAQPLKAGQAPYLFRATGERILFQGFLAVYREGQGDSEDEEADEGTLPALEIGILLDLLDLLAEQHFTQPPPRYGEASLVKEMERLGIGRPSTYASILSTIKARGYVTEQKDGKERKFYPTQLGRAVTDLLVARFPDLLDVQFTAHLEDELDEVAEGKLQWVPLVAGVYKNMMIQLKKAELEVTKIEVPAEENKPTAFAGNGTWKPPTGARRTYNKPDAKPRYGRPTNNSEVETPTKTPRYTPKTASGEETTTKTVRTRRTVKPTADETTVKPTRTRRATATKVTVEPSPTPAYKPPTANAGSQTCPKCEKPMVKRTSTYGEFWGCSDYPNCKGIRKL